LRLFFQSIPNTGIHSFSRRGNRNGCQKQAGDHGKDQHQRQYTFFGFHVILTSCKISAQKETKHVPGLHAAEWKNFLLHRSLPHLLPFLSYCLYSTERSHHLPTKILLSCRPPGGSNCLEGVFMVQQCCTIQRW